MRKHLHSFGKILCEYDMNDYTHFLSSSLSLLPIHTLCQLVDQTVTHSLLFSPLLQVIASWMANQSSTRDDSALDNTLRFNDHEIK